jgi:hypothetical protein
MRSFGTPILIDLISNGGPSVSVTPGASVVPAVFTTGQLKQVVGGNSWPVAAGIQTCTRLTFDQAAAGGSVANYDELFRCVDSLNLFVPNIGTTHSKDAYTGPIAKHVAEFTHARYRYSDHARAQIPSTDGDTTIDLYVFLPFVNENFIEPRDFMPWVGWLLNCTLTVNIATASTIAAVSTGAVTKAASSVRAWIEAYAAAEPTIPVLSQINRYTQAAAAGATNLLLQNVGQPNGLQDVVPGCRLNGIYELMNKLGLGGTSTADNYTGFTMADLGQDASVNLDGLFSSYLRQIGHRGPIGGIGVTTVMADGAGNPYTMAATPNNLLNDVNALYLPYRFAGTEQKLPNVPRWKMGNLNITRTFTAVPSTGSYVVVTNEVRQFGPTTVKALLDAANIPASVREKMSVAYAVKGEGARPAQGAIMPFSIPTRS